MRIVYLMTALLSVAILISCGGGGSDPVNPPTDPVIPPPPDKTTEWTVMLYMGGDNNLAACALADLDELEQVGSTDKVHFTALADIYYEYDSQFGTYLACLPDSSGNLVTPMMHITKNTEEGVQSHLTDTKAVLYQNDGFNSADPANLTNFINWSKQRFPAEHYALVIWDHGSSWLPGRAGSAAVSDNFEGGGNAMYIHEIEAAIKNSGTHLDLLDFTACNMASVEVCYQLKDVTDYICASQKIMIAGNDGVYEAVANYLTSNPKATAEQLGKALVDSYINSYTEFGDFTVTQSLIRTKGLTAIAGAIGQLTPLLADPSLMTSDDLQSTFWEPIRFMQDVDLNNFMDVLPYHTQNVSVASAVKSVKDAVKSAVIYSRGFNGSAADPSWTFGSREFGQGEDIKVDGAAGINIFLPTERDWTQNNFGYYTSIGFAQATGWNWVIAHAYDGVPYLGTAPGNWEAMMAWSTGVDLDLWVFEPDGYGGVIPASPCLGPQSTNGYLSPDSSWTGIPAEAYLAKPEVIWGPYFFLGVYYQGNFFSNDAYCMLGIFDPPTSDEPAVTTDTYYISATQPLDPDFGPGVVFFGFALYNPDDGYWYLFEENRTGDAVTPSQITGIRDQLEMQCPSSTTAKMRQADSFDQQMIDMYYAQGEQLAEDLADQLENE